ncbi:MAG TPA: hypothetical protein EYG74_03390 [Sulfurimonas autotrophica]|nr:hypothetical protein [Sulfurimonas autotrophica]
MRLLLILIPLFLYSTSWGSGCNDSLFSINTYEKRYSKFTIRDVLTSLSVDCHLTILFEDDEAKKRIKTPLDFVNIKGYTFEEFLDFLLNDHNLFYSYDKKKGILKISYMKTETFNIDYLNLTRMTTTNNKTITSGGGANGDGGGSSTDTTNMSISYSFKFWEDLKSGVTTILKSYASNQSTVFINQDAAILTVRSNYEGMKRVKKYLDHLLNKMHKQVMVEAKLIEVAYSESSIVGIDWSKFQTDIQAKVTGGKVKDFPSSMTYSFNYDFSLDGLFAFLKKYGKVKVLSSPKILTLNNQPAVINVGDTYNYRYQSDTNVNQQGTISNSYQLGTAFVGLTLQIIPEITDDGNIIMRINPTSSDTLDTSINDPNILREMPPNMKIKQLTSIVKVRDGQKVLIGGLVEEDKQNNDNKVPVLGDIPLIGKIFHSSAVVKRKRELFILIIPTIIHENNVPTIDEAGL